MGSERVMRRKGRVAVSTMSRNDHLVALFTA